jgi:membrane-associated protease RseP (regulator of RpoE activity)
MREEFAHLRSIAAVLCAALISGASPSPGLAQPPTPAAGVQRVVAWEAMDLSSGSIVLKVQIAGETIDAVLDTGASHSGIDSSLAKRLGIAAEKSVTLNGFSKQVRAHQSVGTQITVAGSEYSTSLLIVDMTATGLEQKMILGRDFLDIHILELEFSNSRFRILDSAEAREISSEPISLISSSRRILRIPVRINGQEVFADLDLGNQNALFISDSAAAQLIPELPRSTWVTLDVSGLLTTGSVAVPVFSVAGTDLRSVPALVMSLPDNASANVGLPILRRFAMTLDLGKSRLWLTPDAAAIERPFERNRLGAALEPQEEGLKILHVALNSPAAAAGLAVGDVIVEIDGRRVTRDNRSELSQIGAGAAGESHRILTKAGRSVVLQLRDYY